MKSEFISIASHAELRTPMTSISACNLFSADQEKSADALELLGRSRIPRAIG